jgi:pyrroloquinoline quinone (PQQ) biosynthesis protein C
VPLSTTDAFLYGQIALCLAGVHGKCAGEKSSRQGAGKLILESTAVTFVPNPETSLPGTDAAGADLAKSFASAIAQIAECYCPSRSPFFKRLRDLPSEVARSAGLLGEIHLVYQSAMHATRAAVYYLPHLDSPSMRKRKLQIFIDDDGLQGGDTHHYQFTRAFKNLGAKFLLTDEEFGESEQLCKHLDAETAEFVRLATTLYKRSLGAWCVVELMSDTWMRALAESLSAHFPAISDEPYFADCFSQGVEERHADESLAVTTMVLQGRPELFAETVEDAKLMAKALDGVWQRLDVVLRNAQQIRPAATSGRRSAKTSRKLALAAV